MEVLAYADGQVVEICEGEGGWRRGCLRPGHLRRRRRALRNPAPVAGEPEEPLRPDRIGASGRGKGGRPGCRRRGPGPRPAAAADTISGWPSTHRGDRTDGDGDRRRGVGNDRHGPERVIRTPYFGRIGKVRELTLDLLQVESGASVRVLEVEFEDGSRTVLPRRTWS